LPKVPGFGVDVLASEIGWAGTAAVGAAMLAQVAGNIVRDKIRPKHLPPEEHQPSDSGKGQGA
jgi:hydrogenase small subunit